MPNQLPAPSTASRDVNEEQFSSDSTKNVEVDENPLQEMEAEVHQYSLHSNQTPQPDEESCAAALVVANESPLDVIEDPT